MVNCNPETVSTDYDTSDRLYFEPLTLEDVLAIVDREKPDGIIVQYGGQTPLKLAVPARGGRRADHRHAARTRSTAPRTASASTRCSRSSAAKRPAGPGAQRRRGASVAERIGYPVLVRPSYVLGGRAMQIVQDVEALRNYMRFAVKASPEHPVLVDRFLADAIEVDVDAICDGERVVVGGIMEHIEEAGVHSGDSACSLPPYSLGADVVDEILARRPASSRSSSACAA